MKNQLKKLTLKFYWIGIMFNLTSLECFFHLTYTNLNLILLFLLSYELCKLFPSGPSINVLSDNYCSNNDTFIMNKTTFLLIIR